ncbi:hypothetical protein RHMOL_Rhmol05G0299100 [Rhododendron molle]|uniref:Uncharacterized protein n=1 Tax=Rhododendron molle TaxID=49168 RepID=A0ACC0NUU6_RHOML|nr:hypothetical protein RHMOL_Rhmol05G0299100 [Rhododendron molle]
MRSYQVLHTDLNRKRDFTGNLDKISIVMSIGRTDVAVGTSDGLLAMAVLLFFYANRDLLLESTQCPWTDFDLPIREIIQCVEK